MKIKSIDQLKRSIDYSSIIIFAVVFSSALIGLLVTHKQYLINRTLLNRQEISSAGNIYKSNLSEKLSIIASSTVFLDYLHSGYLTRQRLYPQFLLQLSTLKSRSIVGIQIFDRQNKPIFSYGSLSPNYISLKLCYLNQNLDPEMGDCQFSWKLFFNENQLISEFLAINRSFKSCENCETYNFIDDKKLGSFLVEKSSDFKFKMGVTDEKDIFFYIYLLLMSATLILSATWSWHRLSSTLNHYIASPIKSLINRLKANQLICETNPLEEIQYLANEINAWKSELKKAQSAKNAEKLAKIAAQLAHDIRSPLSVIDMLLGHISQLPDDCRTTLKHATQRIADIANNFLTQYKHPDADIQAPLTIEHIPPLVESILSEKRSQYHDRHIEFSMSVDGHAPSMLALINAIEFKRLLSNLINNAVESIRDRGYVSLHLSKTSHMLRLILSDNGCGIPSDLMPTIMSGISIGKQNGSGLGLSHAIHATEKWGGELNIQSTELIGTDIIMTLPLKN